MSFLALFLFIDFPSYGFIFFFEFLVIFDWITDFVNFQIQSCSGMQLFKNNFTLFLKNYFIDLREEGGGESREKTLIFALLLIYWLIPVCVLTRD